MQNEAFTSNGPKPRGFSAKVVAIISGMTAIIAAAGSFAAAYNGAFGQGQEQGEKKTATQVIINFQQSGVPLPNAERALKSGEVTSEVVSKIVKEAIAARKAVPAKDDPRNFSMSPNEVYQDQQTEVMIAVRFIAEPFADLVVDGNVVRLAKGLVSPFNPPNEKCGVGYVASGGQPIKGQFRIICK